MKAYEITSEVLKAMVVMAEKGGVTPVEIDNMAEKKIIELGGKSINKGYEPDWAKIPYPRVSCIGINNAIVHSIPSEIPIVDGDIVNFDLGVKDQEDNCGDGAITIPIGQVDRKKARLLYYAKKALFETIKQIKAGVDTEDLAHFIQGWARERKYTVNRKYGGHTIGREMHEKPSIYNTVEPSHKYSKLVEGQQICIEIMLTTGTDDIGILAPDGWTVMTKDEEPSAYFEHQLEVTKLGCKILTSHIDDNFDFY